MNKLLLILMLPFFHGLLSNCHKIAAKEKENKKNEEKKRMMLSRTTKDPGGPEFPVPKRLEATSQNRDSLNHLLQVIFDEYHKELVPKRPTTVRLDLLLIKVKSTNEREGIFESVVALFIEWKDERITWSPDKYGNTTVLAFDSDKVWLPDIAMTNSADHLYAISKDTRFVVRVTHDGSMKFVPTGTARTWCDLRLLTFPFDVQTCSYEFESWSLDSTTMTFNESSDALVDDAFSSPQWALCQHRATVYDYLYEFSGEHFTRVRFDFVVRRKTTFYVINLIFPTTTLSLIQLLVFAIPSTDAASDRVSFGTTNLLTLVVFQTIVTEEMPKSSDSVTALSKYIIALIIISALGILESVAAERLLRPTTTRPPAWLTKIYCPLLWDTQLPTGIAQLTLSSFGKMRVQEGGKLLPPEPPIPRQTIAPVVVLEPPLEEEDEEEVVATGKEPSIVIEYEDDEFTEGCADFLTNRREKYRQHLAKTGKSLSHPLPAKVVKSCDKRRTSMTQSWMPTTHIFREENHYEPLTNATSLHPQQTAKLVDRGRKSKAGGGGEKSPRPSKLLAVENNNNTADFEAGAGGYVNFPPFKNRHSGFVYAASSRSSRQSNVYAVIAALSDGDRHIVDAIDNATLSLPPRHRHHRHQNLRSLDDLNNNNSSAYVTPNELELIDIGRAWGGVVTRLDGLTFLICASAVIVLPTVLFLPLALMEEKCLTYGHQASSS